jgi:hypothetical protein
MYWNLAKQCADESWHADLDTLAQCDLSWFQSLLLTGQIQAFDALYPIDETIDGPADWVLNRKLRSDVQCAVKSIDPILIDYPIA